MKLELDRSEKSGGLFGKKKFVLTTRLIADEVERQVIRDHNLQRIILFDSTRDWGDSYQIYVGAAGCLQPGGDRLECETMDRLLRAEEAIKEGAKGLNDHIRGLKHGVAGSRTIDLDD